MDKSDITDAEWERHRLRTVLKENGISWEHWSYDMFDGRITVYGHADLSVAQRAAMDDFGASYHKLLLEGS